MHWSPYKGSKDFQKNFIMAYLMYKTLKNERDLCETFQNIVLVIKYPRITRNTNVNKIKNSTYSEKIIGFSLSPIF